MAADFEIFDAENRGWLSSRRRTSGAIGLKRSSNGLAAYLALNGPSASGSGGHWMLISIGLTISLESQEASGPFDAKTSGGLLQHPRLGFWTRTH